MDKFLLDILVCPKSGHNLIYFEKTNELVCKKSNLAYPIKNDIISATILAHNCADADAIATAVMVKGYDAGLYWINSIPDVECLLIKKDENGEYIQGRSAGFNY